MNNRNKGYEMKKQKIDEAVVKVEGDTYLHVKINSDNDFDYNIYRQELGKAKLKLIDGGVIERGESIDNLYAAFADIIDGYNLNFKTLEEIDIEDFEATLYGDISVEEMCRKTSFCKLLGRLKSHTAIRK